MPENDRFPWDSRRFERERFAAYIAKLNEHPIKDCLKKIEDEKEKESDELQDTTT